jgi:hypothetical protein
MPVFEAVRSASRPKLQSVEFTGDGVRRGLVSDLRSGMMEFAGATKQELHLMLQNMLMERFRLKVHHETREGRVTTWGQPEPSAPHSSAKAAPPMNDDHSLPDLPSAFGPRTFDQDGFSIIPTEIPIYVLWGPGGRRTGRFDRESMHEFANRRCVGPSCQRRHRPPRRIRFYPALGVVFGDHEWSRARGNPGPTVFAALPQQLGLRLAPSKTQIDVLVVRLTAPA